MTPYEVVYNKPTPVLPEYIIGTSHNEAIDTEMCNQEMLLAKLHSKLLKAQE